jgi:hypothetical protein
MILCVVRTVSCMQVSEVAQLQVCDLHWSHDGAAWHPRYNNTPAVGIYKRQQSRPARPYPRISALVNSRLRCFTQRLEHVTTEECTNQEAETP